MRYRAERGRVVAGVDFSAASTQAARWAATWLLGERDLILAHALVVPEVHGILADRYPVPESLLANARAGALRRLHDVSVTLGVPEAALEVMEGNPADALTDVIRENHAELVVVGKHGEGGLHRGYAGRTADRLVRSSPAPVLVAHGGMSRPPRTILVPLTYSSITPSIISWTRRMYADSGAEVIAIHVVGSAVLSHVLTMSTLRRDNAPSTDEIDEIFREDGDHWRNDLIQAGIPADRVQSEVVFGEVSGAVMAAASEHNADLIVMGSHAGPVRRLLLGSAATAVLREASVPVLIVVEPEETSRTLDEQESGAARIPAFGREGRAMTPENAYTN
jgi:nucleotide-binding universal stress UspA family protein